MNIIIATIVGCASGILASMGLGGGFVLVVYLAIFTETLQKRAQGINLLFFIPITVLAVILHIRNKLIEIKTVLICSAFGIISVIIGFYIVQGISNDWLRKAFAVFIILSGLKELIPKNKERIKSNST